MTRRPTAGRGLGAALLAVERGDLFGVLGVDSAPLQLHGGRQLVGVGEPLLAEHEKAPHLLGMRETVVRLVHLVGDLGNQPIVGREAHDRGGALAGTAGNEPVGAAHTGATSGSSTTSATT